MSKNSRTSAIVTAVGALIMVIAFILLLQQDQKKEEKISEIHEETLTANTELKYKDSINTELVKNTYEQAGYKITSNEDFITRLNADSAIKKLERTPGFNINKELTIQYFVKTVDEDKIWIALNGLGYEQYKRTDSKVQDAPTNGIFYHGRAGLNDVKLIALTLIRCGCKIQRVAPQQKFNNTIQIFGKSMPNAKPLSIEQIMAATSLAQLHTGAPSGERAADNLTGSSAGGKQMHQNIQPKNTPDTSSNR